MAVQPGDATQAHTEEFVLAQTADGLRLDGAVIRPAVREPKPVALVWVHGVGGRFTGKIGLGRLMAAEGYTSLTGATRGSHFGLILRPGEGGRPVLGGACWELFEESPLDVAAWIDTAEALGLGAVALVGHSLGTLKVGYYQATRQDARVVGVAAVSPPRRASELRPEYVALAERMVAEGRGQELLPRGAHHVNAGLMSAQTFRNRARTNLDVYGFHPARPGAPPPRVAAIRCPLFASFGTLEPAVGGEAELAALRRNATAAPRVETHLVEGANHGYAGREKELAALLTTWADTLA